MRYRVELKEIDAEHIEYLKDNSKVPSRVNSGKSIKSYGKFSEGENFENEIITLNIDYDNPDNIKKLVRGQMQSIKKKFRISVGGLLFEEKVGLDRYLYHSQNEPDMTKIWAYQSTMGTNNTNQNSNSYGAINQQPQIRLDEKNLYQCNIWILLCEREEGFVYKKYEINGVNIDSYCEAFDEKEGNRIFSLVLKQTELLMTRNKVGIEVKRRRGRGEL